MIKMTELMRELLTNAVAEGVPCLLGTATKDGRPQISPKGTLAVFDDETLSFWERSYRTSYNAFLENPRVVVYYRNGPRTAELPFRNGAVRFHGVARITEDEAERARVFALSPAIEQSRDPQRKGVAVLIRVDLIEDLAGEVIMQRDGGGQ
jgi:predicted pyridoxine 5'-phosphate oxidase superfamily flavin-nucleotide-binding protein